MGHCAQSLFDESHVVGRDPAKHKESKHLVSVHHHRGLTELQHNPNLRCTAGPNSLECIERRLGSGWRLLQGKGIFFLLS